MTEALLEQFNIFEALGAVRVEWLGASCAIPYGIQNEESQYHPEILLCRHLRQPWDQFWKNFHYFG